MAQRTNVSPLPSMKYPAPHPAVSYDSIAISVPDHEIDKYLQNSRYFIIKSFNEENIRISIKHSEWATTKTN
jgi:hypothetical protein